MMATTPKLKNPFYTLYNEIWSAITHGVGILLATSALTLLVVKAAGTGDALRIGAFTGFGIALILLYTASTLYHALYFTKARHIFQVLDHSGVFILIAGSYLPYCLLAIGGMKGILLLVTIWALCAAGIGMECFFVGRFKKLEVAIYIILGWLCVVAAGPLAAHLGQLGIGLLIAGGVSYTLGALLYTQRQIPYIHVIWHLFVMAGSAFMFFSIYFFV